MQKLYVHRFATFDDHILFTVVADIGVGTRIWTIGMSVIGAAVWSVEEQH